MGDIKKDLCYVISLPRVGFIDTMFSVINSVKDLGIKGRRSSSAFWYQGLEDMLEVVIGQGFKYAVTIDFDTFFTSYHIVDLYEIMEKHPDYGALISIQPRRANPYPMSGLFVDPEGDEIKVSRGGRFIDGVAPADTGNFGLTILRLSELQKLKKPWLRSKPNEKGSWGRGKKDADTNFWLKCKNEGMKVGLAKVYIGHLEMVCSISGPEESNFKTRHFAVNSMLIDGFPEWAIPESMQRERNKNGTNEGKDSGKNQQASGNAAADRDKKKEPAN